MQEPKSPKAWAAFLAKVWGDRFPVDVQTIALEYSRRYSDSIKDIQPASVGASFEGALYPLPKSGKWAILYNPNIKEEGRINFTLAHELGHYLNHRHLRAEGFECSDQALLAYDKDEARRKLEQEADSFASYLLMPMNDYRSQVKDQQMTLDLLEHCTDRYKVSMTAAVLKWLEFTEERAVLVYARDGFVLWGQRSDAAKKSGIYFPSGFELPVGSVAGRGPSAQEGRAGTELPPGVWRPMEPVREMTIFANSYDATISLLIFPKTASSRFSFAEPHVEDVFERMSRGSK